MMLVCRYCGKSFSRFASQMVCQGNYCSISCSNKARTKYDKVCIVCQQHYKGDKLSKYCTRSCYYTDRKIKTNPLNCYCNKCGKAFHCRPYQMYMGGGRFCSLKCKSEWQTGIFKKGSPSHYYATKGWKSIRKTILERDGYKCTNCGNTSGELHINHIKLRELGGTDTPDNLETLCKRCHAIKDIEVLRGLTGNDKARYRDWNKKLLKRTFA